MSNQSSDVKIQGLSPILATADLPATVEYYCRVLGFDREWLWGNPPTHGAVRRGSIQIQLSLNPELAARSMGNQYFIFVGGVDELHRQHVAAGAEIVSPIENKPWGMREYTVRDPNGYQLRFAGDAKYESPSNARKSLPPHIRIVERPPTAEEYLAITNAVSWPNHSESVIAALKGTVFAAVAVDASSPGQPTTVGMIRVIGDGALAFYLQDVAVMPSHQNQRIGSALVDTAMKWLHEPERRGSFVGLFTFKPAFYERLGFKADLGGLHAKA